jgi:serine/threonine protein phosphatase 1
MKVFVIGDIHGCYKALLQCIERSGINKDEDTLIVLGDIVDGWHQVPESIEELLTFKNLILIRGNHDQWFMNYAKTGEIASMWYRQGGAATLVRYEHDKDLVCSHMEKYFNKTLIYYIDTNRNYAFMHGGYNWHMPLKDNTDDVIMWDRHMIETAQTWHYEKGMESFIKFKEFDKIFVGHTTTQYSSNRRHKASLLPAFLINLINMDTGGGWNGKLSIMDIDTLEYWQSDLVLDIYPTETNRRANHD